MTKSPQAADSVPQMLEGTEPPESPAVVDLISLRGTLKSLVTGITLKDMKEAIREGATGERSPGNELLHH